MPSHTAAQASKQAEDVGEIVAGVGEERGRVRDEAVDALHDDDQHVQPDRQRERAALAFLRRVMVMMLMAAAVTMVVAVRVVVVVGVGVPLLMGMRRMRGHDSLSGLKSVCGSATCSSNSPSIALMCRSAAR